jgi:hypothetical protein
MYKIIQPNLPANLGIQVPERLILSQPGDLCRIHILQALYSPLLCYEEGDHRIGVLVRHALRNEPEISVQVEAFGIVWGVLHRR